MDSVLVSSSHKYLFLFLIYILFPTTYVNADDTAYDVNIATFDVKALNNLVADINVAKIATKGTEPVGKIQLPATLSIDLMQPAEPRNPFSIIISAESNIPISSGIVTLTMPYIDSEPNRQELLWSGNPSGFVSKTVEFTIKTLPEGQYHFIAIFRFTPNRPNAEELALSRSLYIDVRPDAILSSNISFTQIKRLELRKELEERIVMDLVEGATETTDSNAIKQKMIKFKATDPNIIALKMAEFKARDPNIIETKIAELITSDPNVAKRIQELNREPLVDPNSVKPVGEVQLDANREPVRSPTAPSINKTGFEEPAPIPDRLKDIDTKNHKEVQKAPLHGVKQAVQDVPTEGNTIDANEKTKKE